MDEVVIGEGVVLEADASSVVTRCMEGVIDVAAIVGLAMGISLLLNTLDAGSFSGAVTISYMVLLFVVVPTTIETLTRGRSLGKLALGTRVVRDDGGPVSLRHALTRALVGVLEIWMTFGIVAAFASLSNRKGKRLGDLVAGTYVVRVRGARGIPPLPPVDPSLRQWARGADVVRLPDALALAVRIFLARSAGMDRASRLRVARDLAAKVEPLVAPGPPWGTPPEAFLAAVMAERRERDWATGVRDQHAADVDAAAIQRLPFRVADPAR